MITVIEVPDEGIQAFYNNGKLIDVVDVHLQPKSRVNSTVLLEILRSVDVEAEIARGKVDPEWLRKISYDTAYWPERIEDVIFESRR